MKIISIRNYFKTFDTIFVKSVTVGWRRVEIKKTKEKEAQVEGIDYGEQVEQVEKYSLQLSQLDLLSSEPKF